MRRKEPAPPKGRLRCGLVTVKELVTEQLRFFMLAQILHIMMKGCFTILIIYDVYVNVNG